MDPVPEESLRTFCENYRVTLIQGDVTDPDNLRRIGANRSDALYAVHKDEKTNIRIAEQLREYADLRTNDSVHALIIGFGPQGRALAQEVALQCRYRDLLKPRVTAVSLWGTSEAATFIGEFPVIHKACDFEYLHAETGNWLEVLEELRLQEKQCPLSAIYVATGDETLNLSIALGIREEAEKYHNLLAPVFVQAADGEDFRNLLEVTEGTNECHRVLQPFGIYSEAIADSALVDFSNEALAITIHRSYQNKTAGGNVWSHNALVDWFSLSEVNRERNRRAAVHARVKLASAGFRVNCDLNDPVALRGDPAKNRDMLEQLARLEHDRWMASKYVDGWDYSPTRNNARKLHDCLVDFDDLSAPEQRKDLEVIRSIFDWPRENAGAATINTSRRITIGVLAGPESDETEMRALRKAVCSDYLPNLCPRENPGVIRVVTGLLPGQNDNLCHDILATARGLQLDTELIYLVPYPWGDFDDADEYLRLAEPGENASQAERRLTLEFAERALGAQWLIHLHRFRAGASDDAALRESLEQRLAIYLAQRSDLLVVAAGNNASSQAAVTFRAAPHAIDPALSTLPPNQSFRRPINRHCLYFNQESGQVIETSDDGR